MTEVLCIYHANCADGLGAAWAVHRALGDGVEFVAAEYRNTPYLDGTFKDISCVGRDVLIVDFSFPLPVLRAMAAEARSVLVLDHHKTAQEDLAEIPRQNLSSWANWIEYCTLGGKGCSNLAAIFDLDRSGAGIAWDYLHGQSGSHGIQPAPRPHIVDLIEDFELSRFRFGDESRAFHAVLASYDWTDLPSIFALLSEWDSCSEFDGDWTYILSEGRAILRAQCIAVERAVRATRRTMRVAGHVVPVANVPTSMASEAGELLIDQSSAIEYVEHIAVADNSPPFTVTYYDGADGKRHFSLRSPRCGANVGKIARREAQLISLRTSSKFTGGGHEHAAGFDAPIGWEGK